MVCALKRPRLGQKTWRVMNYNLSPEDCAIPIAICETSLARHRASYWKTVGLFSHQAYSLILCHWFINERVISGCNHQLL